MSSSAPPSPVSILALPVSPAAPPYHLTPDPLVPSVSSLLSLSSYAPSGSGMDSSGKLAPSGLRRTRQITGGGAFSFVSPLPAEFPYAINQPKTGKEPTTIEAYLASLEPSPELMVSAAKGDGYGLTSEARLGEDFPKPKLLAISHKAAQHWLPQLELGKADGTEEELKVREELVSVLAGQTVYARLPDDAAADKVEHAGFAPWSLCYAGHQFGQWAGQLGDGRAISILSTPTTPQVATATGAASVEVQLKGAGRTPYSRFADGLAVLRSSVREFLGAEASAALRIPTSRALALVALPNLQVQRERMETAAVVTRLNESWIRIGSFEMQKSRQEFDSLRRLTGFVGRDVFRLDGSNTNLSAELTPTRGLGSAVLAECSRRSALLVASWQAYGFMHGVLNTDNFAVTGETIDYGPYAFMDRFDPNHVCNHSDEEERYSFKNQPTMGLFAISKLGAALAELIGCEEHLADQSGPGATSAGLVEVPAGWAEDRSKLAEYAKAAEPVIQSIKQDFTKHFMDEYTRLMRLRLGFVSDQPEDFTLASELLTLLANFDLDHAISHRLLGQFPGLRSPQLDGFLDLLLPADIVPEHARAAARDDARAFLERYEARLAVPAEADAAATRRERMDGANPRFVLRQWVLEETIAKLDKEGDAADVATLERVLEMAGQPFESYGEVEVGEVASRVCPTKEEQERERLCGMGDGAMLGFQCSCSS